MQTLEMPIPVSTGKSGETILVVEDDPGVMVLQRKYLERADYHVVTADNAENALRIVLTGQVDLVVLDNQLPKGRTGLELIEQMKVAGHRLPVIMVTGYSDEATVINALRAGVRDFVSKSVEYLEYLPMAVERVFKHIHTESLLVQSEARLTNIVSSAMDAILAIDSNLRVSLFNPAAEELFGCPAAEAIGAPINRFIADAVGATTNAQARSMGPGGVMTPPLAVRMEMCGVHAGGKTVPLEVSVSQAMVDGKRMCTLIARDISERKRSEEALAEQATGLARSNDDLERFAYVASHDLQEPLRMVASYLQLLQRRYQSKLDAAADEFIAFAVDGAKRMQNLLHDLLAYSRAGSPGKTFEAVNCAAVLNQVLTNLKVAIMESAAVVTHGPMPTVQGDATQIAEVLQNLIGNAIKFRRAEPARVYVGAQRQGKEWVFAVHDNGIGIDPQYRERIFVIFQRLHSREEYNGTGIGLAICKKIVERRGGRIWVESQPGNGATFYFSVPE